MEHALKQMQYRFAVIYETPSSNIISILFRGHDDCVFSQKVIMYSAPKILHLIILTFIFGLL